MSLRSFAAIVVAAAGFQAFVPHEAGAAPRPTSVVDVTAITGGMVTGPVTSWQTKNGPYNVEHLAGRSPSGDLLVFYWSPQHDWRMVNVSQKTGRKIGGPVTSWQTRNGPYNVEHLAGQSPSGDLLVFYWSPQHDWRAVNVSQKTGRKILGPLTSWQMRRGSYNVEHLAGRSPSGDLLVFYWSPQHDWRAVNVSAKTGRKIGGPVTSWQIKRGFFPVEHLAAVGTGGELIDFSRSPLQDWRVAVERSSSWRLTGPLASWQTKGSFGLWSLSTGAIERIAGTSTTGDLITFSRSSQGSWRAVNATRFTGAKVVGGATAYQVKDGIESVEVLSTRGPDSALLLHWRKPSLDWQTLNLSEITGRSVAADPVGWVTPGSNGVEHLAAAGPDQHLRVFWGLSRERSLTDALSRPVDGIKRMRHVNRKVLTILWDPHKPGIVQPSKATMQATLFGATNSVRDYFLENSNGYFTIENAGILGWYDSNYPPSEYWPGNGKAGRDSGAEAIRKAAASLDLKRFDTNKDGQLKPEELAILFIIPGTGDGGGLNRTVGEDYTTRQTAQGITVDGVKIRDIAEVSIGNPPGPGIVAHELSHLLLHLGDMYFSFSNPFAAGAYSLMDQDGAAPHLDPVSKLKLGWLRPKIIFRSGRYKLTDVETRHGVAILMDPRRGTDEYFIVENRWPGTSYDKVLPGSGLGIWHVMETSAIAMAALPPPTVSTQTWSMVGPGLSRKGIRMVRPSLVFSNSRALWDSSEYNLLSVDPDPQHAVLKWGDGTPSGFALRSFSPAGAEMETTIEVPR